MSKVNWEAVAKEQMKITHDRNEQIDLAINAMQTAVQKLNEYEKSDVCFNAIISYMLGKGYMESPLEFLRCWNEGNFEELHTRACWNVTGMIWIRSLSICFKGCIVKQT